MPEDNVTYLVPPGSLRCYLTGKLRKDTPEENVRQRWARSLVEEYSYTLGGSFQPSSFLASLELLDELAKANELRAFTKVRRDFEEFLVANKSLITLLVHTRGSGGRSRGRIKQYYRFVLDCFLKGMNAKKRLKK